MSPFRPIADLLIMAAVVIVTGMLAFTFDLSDRFIAWTRPIDVWQLDEFPLVLLMLSLAMIWYAYRRRQELAGEIRRRQQMETALVESEKRYRHLVECTKTDGMTRRVKRPTSLALPRT